MIASVCAQLDQRALVVAGWSDFSDVPRFEHVKLVGAVNHATTFPGCRAVVHHGGAGSTAASLRAGVATLVLWFQSDQPYWGTRVKQLKVGTAREIATRMTNAAPSVAKAGDHMENLASVARIS